MGALDRLRPPEEVPELAARLDALVARARAAWPHLGLRDAEFVAHVAARLPLDLPLVAGLEALHVEDLFLACACAHGDPEALAALEAAYFADVDVALTRERGAVDADDFKQALRERLYVSTDGNPPRIASYAARGNLRTWLRVTVTNALHDARDRARRREAPATDAQLAALAATAPDPEMQHFKACYRDEFERAFRIALEALAERDRRVLYASIVEGASIDVIARDLGKHRATAARWLEHARDTLRRKTRRQLCRRLGMSLHEYDSVVRLVRSQVDVRL